MCGATRDVCFGPKADIVTVKQEHVLAEIYARIFLLRHFFRQNEIWRRETLCELTVNGAD
jgi:hypothetical protein